uniref:Nucleolin like protein CiRGG1 n=1 Tax=Ciona intestinalis TaxID=7719 RepID=F7A5D0_CIOIN
MVQLKKKSKSDKTSVIKPVKVTKAKKENVEMKKGKKSKKVAAEPEATNEENELLKQEVENEENDEKVVKTEDSDDEQEESADESSDDDDSEEEEKVKPKVAKKESKSKAKKVVKEINHISITKNSYTYSFASTEKNEEEVKLVKRKATETEEVATKKVKLDPSEVATLLFTELPEGLNDAVFNKFLKSKEIKCVACRANYGRQKAYVDVRAEDKDAALQLHQVEWKGQEIQVTEAQSKAQDRKGDFASNRNDKDERTLFVKNLPYSADENAIAELFDGVKEVRLLTDRESGRPKGMAFIEFDSTAEKETAFGLKDELEMDGRSLYLDNVTGGGGGGRGRGNRGGRGGFGRGGGGFGAGRGRGGRGPSAPSKTLFVKGITEDMTRDTLYETFSGATDIRIPQDRDTGKNKFFAYVEYQSESSATEVYKSSKGGMHVD